MVWLPPPPLVGRPIDRADRPLASGASASRPPSRLGVTLPAWPDFVSRAIVGGAISAGHSMSVIHVVQPRCVGKRRGVRRARGRCGSHI